MRGQACMSLQSQRATHAGTREMSAQAAGQQQCGHNTGSRAAALQPQRRQHSQQHCSRSADMLRCSLTWVAVVVDDRGANGVNRLNHALQTHRPQ